MKGFMHVVEIILVAILVFFIFSQFASIPRTVTEWDKAKLYLMGNDLLFSLNEQLNDSDWFNKTGMKKKLESILPRNVLYGLRLENVIKPEIHVGCLCDDTQLNYLNNSVLIPFEINGVKVSFVVTQIGDLSEAFSFDFDVTVFFDYIDYDDFRPEEVFLRRFLEKGKGVVEIFDPPLIDPIQENYFGLNFSDNNPNTNNITFTLESQKGENEIYQIYKYFHHLPLNETTENPFQEGFEFNNYDYKFLSPDENVTQKYGDGRKVVLEQDSGVKACIVNYGVGGEGRTVWLSGVDDPQYSDSDEYKLLIKSLIVWAAGDKYDVTEAEIEKPVSTYMFKLLNKDMFQAIKIVLNLGYSY
jgi:hypothetical protein